MAGPISPLLRHFAGEKVARSAFGCNRKRAHYSRAEFAQGSPELVSGAPCLTSSTDPAPRRLPFKEKVSNEYSSPVTNSSICTGLPQLGELARKIDRPVQLTWSRWQETLAGFPRAPMAASLSASFDPARQRLIGWRARLASPPWAIEAGARLFGGMDAAAAQGLARDCADPLAVAGALPVYAIPDRAVDHVPAAISLPVGRMRGGAHALTAFFTESFIDECAHAAGAEPLSFRAAMLGEEPRLVACLEGVAHLATWGGGGGGSGQGLACHRLALTAPEGVRTGYIAVIAKARVLTAAGGPAVHVENLAACCDIGRVVNRDIARQQIEGGLLFGMALATGAGTRWALGLPTAARLGDLRLPLLADCPKVDIAFAVSDAEPFDPGELGMVAVAPAIGNALFSASGTRFRRLPFLTQGPS